MLICLNVEGIRGQGKVGNPCSKHSVCFWVLWQFFPWLKQSSLISLMVTWL